MIHTIADISRRFYHTTWGRGWLIITATLTVLAAAGMTRRTLITRD